jgi:hypothetical protein
MRGGRIERFADVAGLGEVEAVYRPGVAPVIWFASGVPLSLGGVALWTVYSAPADGGPGRVIWPLLGVAFAVVCLGLAVASALDSGRRIAVCRHGLLHRRGSRVETVPWPAVRHLRRRSRTSYELDAGDGVSISWDEELPGHARLFHAIESRVTPLFVTAARERLTAGDHVSFDGLVVTADGLTAEGILEPLPWRDVAGVTFGPLGEPVVARLGQAEPWFTGMVNNQAALRILLTELLPRPVGR